MIAARVAADLEKESNLEVKKIKGGLGELSVDVNGKQIYSANRLWYPTPASILNKVRSVLKNSEKRR